MSEVHSLAIGFAAGLGLGIVHFGGLWVTLQRVRSSGHSPALLTAGSFLARALVTLLGFYWVAGAGWLALAGSLVGFIVARFALSYALTNRSQSNVDIEGGDGSC
jgi:F1F0 ATPase subunit 2